MKQKFFVLCAVAVLLLGMPGCSKKDTPAPAPNNVYVMEQDLVGLWWDEYDFSGETEDGKAFSRGLMVLDVEADHTGCIYMSVFDNTSDEPLAVYGGPEDAGFTWRLLADGTIVLGDPDTGDEYEGYALTRSADSVSYKGRIDVSNTKLTYSDRVLKVKTGSYFGGLVKADASKSAEIWKLLLQAANAKTLAQADAKDIGKIVGADGKIYNTKAVAETVATGNAVAMIAYVGNKTGHATYKHGLAIALADESDSGRPTMEWSLAKSMCEGKTDPIGAEWMLPSLDQWKTMFEANGNNNALFSGLDALLGAAGGKGSKLVHNYYWSSEHDGGYANYVELFNGNASFFVVRKDYGCRVRACLAF